MLRECGVCQVYAGHLLCAELHAARDGLVKDAPLLAVLDLLEDGLGRRQPPQVDAAVPLHQSPCSGLGTASASLDAEDDDPLLCRPPSPPSTFCPLWPPPSPTQLPSNCRHELKYE